MIKLLKKNTPINYALMLVLMFLLWAFKLSFMPTEIESYETSGLFSINADKSLLIKYMSALLAITILYLFSLLLIKINSDLLIVDNAYQSPGIVFILFSGFFINSQHLNSLMFASLLLFLAIIIQIYAYNKFIALNNTFNSGLIMSVAILIYPKFIVFVPLMFITLFIVKPVNWREIASMILGLLSPLILYYTISWLYGDINNSWIKTISNITQTFTKDRYSTYSMLVFFPIIAWVVIALFSRISLNIPRKVSTRKFQTLLSVFLLYYLIFFISPIAPNESVTGLYAPSAILLSAVFVYTKNWIGKTLFWGLIGSIIFSQLIQINFYISVF